MTFCCVGRRDGYSVEEDDDAGVYWAKESAARATGQDTREDEADALVKHIHELWRTHSGRREAR